jgi:ABC-type transporter Mla subunit MlaD
MDDTLNLLLDLIIIVLLVPTIVYAVILNTRLKQLRDNRDDLARLVAAFNDATARAESGIPKLRRAAEEAGQSLQERVEKAQTLRDDLAFMTERADSMAGRLEDSVRQARDEVRPAIQAAAPAPQVAPARAPRAGSGSSRAAAAAPSPIGSPARSAPRSAPIAAPTLPDPTPVLSDGLDDERSEAERELLRALQSVR